MMKKVIKKLLKHVIPYRVRAIGIRYISMSKYASSKEILCRGHVYYDEKPGSVSSIRLFNKILQKLVPLFSHSYIYTYDPMLRRVLPIEYDEIVSITPDYGKILKSNLDSLSSAIGNSISDASYVTVELEVVNVLKSFAHRLLKYKSKYPEYSERLVSIPGLLDRDCRTLDEAIQKLLFYNGLLWQYGHRHNGLGRLDIILYPYYKNDLLAGKETYESAKHRIKNMCLVLGSLTKAKSMTLVGDTGQYIMLGGIDENGDTVENDLTHIFLEIFTEIHIPDPKLILRVNDTTTDLVWSKAIASLATGCGSPLVMNEGPIMQKMSDFGYGKSDVWNVGTSACWEPLIIGMSADQNNPFRSIVACASLNSCLKTRKPYSSFLALLEDVKSALASDVNAIVRDLHMDYSPLLTLFSDKSLSGHKDYFHGGSEYAYHGMQVVGLPNLVNSLMNIRDYVFEQKLFTLEDCTSAIENNYSGYEDMRQLFISPTRHKFGSTDAKVESLTNGLISSISKAISSITLNGNRVKFGLSSPNYIGQGKSFPATLDGRKAGDPFAVHISPVSSDIDIDEVLHFASEIDYPTNCINGNVTDFIIPTAYIKNREKLISIMKDACKGGVNQIQLNVLDKDTLINAKKHPEKYPTLIVRVWGFSAYFNDLPEEYQDYLIKRAETYGATA